MTDALADRPTEIAVDASERAHDGFRQIDVLSFRHRVNGEADFEPGIQREVLRSPPIVAVLACDPVADRVVLIRQFRLGAHLATGKGMLVEVVAGAVDPGEAPEKAAARELKEETGLLAKRLAPIARFLPSPGISDEFVHLYLAEVDSTALAERGGYDATETTYPFACSPDDAIEAADRGAISNVFTLLALNWLDRHKETIFHLK